MGGFLVSRKNSVEEIKEKYGFKTIEDLTLDELYEIKGSIVRNPYGKAIGYILKIIADRRNKRAEKIVIKILREEDDLIVREKIIEVRPNNVVLLEGYLFLVKNLNEYYVNKIIRKGLPNVLSEINLVSTKEGVSLPEVPTGAGKNLVTKHETQIIQTPEVLKSFSTQDTGYRNPLKELRVKNVGYSREDRERIAETLETLKEKYRNLRLRAQDLTQKWFKGLVELDDYIAEKERILKEIDEVKRLIAGFTGDFSYYHSNLQ
ncbi:MAG: hypothetical protein DRJ47_04325 [Thermoprotei archaeon]|nr:MAG: hypothetical protein DRJ47_04325 [Thermoprotei archaeon]